MTQTVFFIVPEETHTSTSSTVTVITTDGSDLLMFKYGQTGSGKGQSSGYTSQQILQFACDPRMMNLTYGNDSVPEDNQEIIWGRVQDVVETLMKEREEKKDGKGKEVVDEEGVSSVRTEGSGSRGSGNGGSRPGFWGRIPKLSTVVSNQDFKVRVKEVGDTNRSLALNPGRPYVSDYVSHQCFLSKDSSQWRVGSRQ